MSSRSPRLHPPFVARSLRFPRELWLSLERAVPAGERSAFIRMALERELARAEHHLPLCDRLLESLPEVRDNEWDRLPRDLSDRLDDYVYPSDLDEGQ